VVLFGCRETANQRKSFMVLNTLQEKDACVETNVVVSQQNDVVVMMIPLISFLESSHRFFPHLEYVAW
jgi:flavoprotein